MRAGFQAPYVGTSTVCLGHSREVQERLMTGNALDCQKAAEREYPVALHNGSPFQTERSHTVVKTARFRADAGNDKSISEKRDSIPLILREQTTHLIGS